jgi:hypothetical protein
VLRLGSVYTDPYRLGDPFPRFTKGQTEQATGGWIRLESLSSQARARLDPRGPDKGQPPRFSPEQICLDVGRIQAPARLAWAIALCAPIRVAPVLVAMILGRTDFVSPQAAVVGADFL